MITTACTVNGEAVEIDITPSARLLDMLRWELGLTGSKEGCGVGECGACTVILNGRAVDSCLVMAATCDGATIITIEGLQQQERLHPLQQAFIDHGAAQCGYCIPGFLVMAKSYVDEHSRPAAEELRTALAGNLCRCTGYRKIIEAIIDAARGMDDLMATVQE